MALKEYLLPPPSNGAPKGGIYAFATAAQVKEVDAVFDGGVDNLFNSARVIGCKIGQIAKTLFFLMAEEPVVILMSGEAKNDNMKYRAHFCRRADMIPYSRVEELTGYIPGAVSPYLLTAGVRVYLDISLKRYDIVYTAAGSLNSTVKLTLEELAAHSGSCGWVGVCKNWEAADNIAV